jgi:hypothetical protein
MSRKLCEELSAQRIPVALAVERGHGNLVGHVEMDGVRL